MSEQKQPKAPVSGMPPAPDAYRRLARNKKIGLALIFTPVASLFTVMVVFAATTFLTAPAATGMGAPPVEVNIFKFIISFLGILCVAGIIIGFPLGIIFFLKKEPVFDVYDERSGRGKASVIPPEIDRWNWGAAGLTWIWGIFHGVWVSLLALIPVVNIFMVLLLGYKGNVWAWRAQKWASVAEFVDRQKRWSPWGVVFFVLMMLGLLLNGLNLSAGQ